MREAGPSIRAAKTADRYALIMIPLTHPEEGATKEEQDAWETQCDRCGMQCMGIDFHTGALSFDLVGGGKANITFGLCRTCKMREVGGE
jgi:hypothetical protein